MPRTRNFIALLLALVALCVTAGPAAAQSLEITEFQTTSSSTLAGDHPDLETKFKLAHAGDPEIAKNITFELPEGIYGNPSVLSECSSVDFALNQCPPGSQAGTIILRANYEGNPDFLLGISAVYSVTPGAGEAARFAFTAPTLDVPIVMPVNVLSADGYRLAFTVAGATQLAPVASADIKFWGFPAAEIHTGERFGRGDPDHPQNCPGQESPFCANHTEFAPAGVPVAPFTGNPSLCGVPMPTTLRVETYQSPGAANEIEDQSQYEPTTGCARQTFKPLGQAKLTTTEADSPSGLDLIVRAGQVQSTAAAPSQVRKVVLNLPEGLTINPDAADGQSDCTDAQAKIGLEVPGECPDKAKIGTISISSAALPGLLNGSIYFGEPKPGNQYRLLILADGFGIHTKFVGDLLPNPETGQITAVFDNLPELPFDEYGIHLFASDRGVLATPTRCGIHTTESDLYPWNNLLADRKSTFGVSIDSSPGGALCPGEKREFNPRLEAGTSNSQAGGFSDFHLKLDRNDGDQFLGDLNFTMPPGLTGSLRGLTYCPDAAIAAAAVRKGREEQAAPSCPASSQLGTTNVAAGPGSHPFHAYGSMYLAGPLKGAPFSLVAITPALAGPYDYGVVVVRVAINVDPRDAHVIAVSDTVPAIIGGVPIRMRSIQVNLDKPNFIINPTSCSPMSVDSQGIGDQGTIADFSSYFQAVNCSNLPFQPKFAVKAVGRKSTKRNSNPALRFDLNTRPGDANIKSISVTLPRAYEIDQAHLGNICTEKELALTDCAGKTPIGKASTATPLLDQPLSGLVYAVSGGGGLPRLAFLLNGQVSLVPRAEEKSVGYGLKTVVPVVPDAPIGHFSLEIFGGKTGYLLNTRDTCLKLPVIKVGYTAQSGKTYAKNVRVKGCSSKTRKKLQRKHRAR